MTSSIHAHSRERDPSARLEAMEQPHALRGRRTFSDDHQAVNRIYQSMLSDIQNLYDTYVSMRDTVGNENLELTAIVDETFSLYSQLTLDLLMQNSAYFGEIERLLQLAEHTENENSAQTPQDDANPVGR